MIAYFASGGGKDFVVWFLRNRLDMEFFAEVGSGMGFSEALQA